MVTQQELQQRQRQLASIQRQASQKIISTRQTAQRSRVGPQSSQTPSESQDVPVKLFDPNELLRGSRGVVAARLEAQAKAAIQKASASTSRRVQRGFREIATLSRQAAARVRSGRGVISSSERVTVAKARKLSAHKKSLVSAEAVKQSGVMREFGDI